MRSRIASYSEVKDEFALGWIVAPGPPQQVVAIYDPHIPTAEPDRSTWYTKAEACKKLGVSGRELDRMVEAGWLFGHGEPLLLAVGLAGRRRSRRRRLALERIYD